MNKFSTPSRSALSAAVVIAVVVCGSVPAEAQSSAAWIKSLDRNRNGYVDPDEWSSRSRSFVERFAGDAGLDLSRPVSVRKLEYAAQRYYDKRAREASESMPLPAAGAIPDFTADPQRPVVPDFSSSRVKYPYTREDLERADETLRRYDRNSDGYLDREEIARARWRDSPPGDSDLDRDGRLSRSELAQRYAKQRMLDRLAALPQVSASPGSSEVSSSAASSSSTLTFERRSRSNDRGSRTLAYYIIQRYDLNRNGTLEARELAAAGISMGKADYNRDGVVERDELAEYLFQEMESQGNDLSEMLPTWFFERDLNGDGQVEMSEFTDVWTPEKAEEFASYDTNGDGIITPDELLTSKRLSGGDYANNEAEILLPRSIVVSEIQVDEDIEIGELKVQLSITHTYVSHLDGYLIGPEGQRIELFSQVGGSDDHFDRTIFSDKASTSITKSRPPYRGTYQPGALAKKQSSLSTFNGKSMKGVWQLMIRSSRSDRSGVLHGWSLIVQPSQDSVDRLSE